MTNAKKKSHKIFKLDLFYMNLNIDEKKDGRIWYIK